jgi:hypothetical protein
MLDTINPGTPVRTTKPVKQRVDWDDETKASRRWNIDGTVVGWDESTKSYEVAHKDGTKSRYERKELRRGDVQSYTVAEREEMIAKMRAVSDAFYGPATLTGVHAFIEFCGLMNEFIVVCQASNEQDIDFTMANTHTGQPLAFATHKRCLPGREAQLHLRSGSSVGREDQEDVRQRALWGRVQARARRSSGTGRTFL